MYENTEMQEDNTLQLMLLLKQALQTVSDSAEEKI